MFITLEIILRAGLAAIAAFLLNPPHLIAPQLSAHQFTKNNTEIERSNARATFIFLEEQILFFYEKLLCNGCRETKR